MIQGWVCCGRIASFHIRSRAALGKVTFRCALAGYTDSTMKMTQISLRALLCTALTAALTTVSAPALAELPKAEINVLPGWRMENGQHMAALHVVLEPGWKTYWRAPGDGGIPPEMDWTGSENLETLDYHWPVPEVIEAGGIATIGYRYEMVLPFEVTPEVAGEDVRFSADLLLGICENICVPVSDTLSADFRADVTTPAPVILGALENRPDTRREAGVVSVTCAQEDLSDGIRVHATLDMPRLAEAETVVFETADREIWVSETMGARDDAGRLAVHADLVPPDAKPFDMAADDLRITVIGAGRAVDVPGCDTLVPAK